MGKHILLVDDERHVLTLLEHTLAPFEEVDVSVLLASSGEEALELCRDNSPDLVFVDVGMPGIGGYAFCEAIRSVKSARHVNIVLMVEMGRDANQSRCKAADVSEVLTKPFDPDHVRLLAGRLLNIDVEL